MKNVNVTITKLDGRDLKMELKTIVDKILMHMFDKELILPTVPVSDEEADNLYDATYVGTWEVKGASTRYALVFTVELQGIDVPFVMTYKKEASLAAVKKFIGHAAKDLPRNWFKTYNEVLTEGTFQVKRVNKKFTDEKGVEHLYAAWDFNPNAKSEVLSVDKDLTKLKTIKK